MLTYHTKRAVAAGDTHRLKTDAEGTASVRLLRTRAVGQLDVSGKVPLLPGLCLQSRLLQFFNLSRRLDELAITLDGHLARRERTRLLDNIAQ